MPGIIMMNVVEATILVAQNDGSCRETDLGSRMTPSYVFPVAKPCVVIMLVNLITLSTGKFYRNLCLI